MNVGEAKRKTLMLIREYSNNGRKIAEQKNADYLLSMNHFFDTAQKEIAQVAKISAHADLVIPETDDYYAKIGLPDDFMELDKVVLMKNDYYGPFTDYKWEGKKTILVRPGIEGTITVHYFKYPETIPFDDENPTAYDSMEFELSLEAQELIPFLAGSLVMADENVSMADSLKNDYMVKVSNLSKSNVYDIDKIQNVYGLI